MREVGGPSQLPSISSRECAYARIEMNVLRK